MKGQIQIGIVLAIGGAVGGSVMWVYNLISPIKEDVSINSVNIAVVREAIKCIPDMQRDIRNTNDNLIKLMSSQGIRPIEKMIPTATTTGK